MRRMFSCVFGRIDTRIVTERFENEKPRSWAMLLMDCAGRAERRRRFGNANACGDSCAPGKKAVSPLRSATAVQKLKRPRCVSLSLKYQHELLGLRRHDAALAALFEMLRRCKFGTLSHFTVKPKRGRVSAVQGLLNLSRPYRPLMILFPFNPGRGPGLSHCGLSALCGASALREPVPRE